MFKKAVAICTAFLLMMISSAAGASGLFPTTNEMFGKAMPSIGMAIGRAADAVEETEDGLTETYLHFGAEEYIAFGQYLSGNGAVIREIEIAETEMRALIAVRDGEMSLTYNWAERKGTAGYPAGTRPEKEKSAEEGGDCLLPPVGGILPSAEFAVGRAPDEVRAENGGTRQIFSKFSDEDYTAFSLYLGQSGAELKSRKTEFGVLEAAIGLHGAAFDFAFDWNQQTASCFYPEGTNPESCRCVAGGKSAELLPGLESIGQELPSLSMAVDREPIIVKIPKDGGIQEVYDSFSDADYDTFSKYLSAKDCRTEDYQIQQDSVLVVQLSNRSGRMTFTYDAVNHEAKVSYPAFSRVEKVWPETRSELHPGDVVTFGHYEQDNDPKNGAERRSELTPGNVVTFGRYEQDNNMKNGPEEIEWIVLAVEADRALLLSKYGLDAVPYHMNMTPVTWKKCSLRTWLNQDFLSAAFTEEEQSRILVSAVDNSWSQGYEEWRITGGGKDTQDRIFLLSYKEAFQDYFEDDQQRRCEPTAYAVKRGAITGKDGACWWWLRSPGHYTRYAADVRTDGSHGDCLYAGPGCVRPAFWLDLESGIFQSETSRSSTPNGSASGSDSINDETAGETQKDALSANSSSTRELSEEEYNQYAALFIGIIKATLKNPNSLDVHWVKVMEYNDDMYIVINYSAMNGFGGYNRDTWSFKYRPGYISLTGDSSDYDAYEKHQHEFYEIRSLNVEDVMRFVN